MSYLSPLVEEQLKDIMHKFSCSAGSVHVLVGEQLFLVAAIGLPGPVLKLVSVVPMGKGLAGLAAQRKEQVQVCNLQTDESGRVRPGAKATGVEGAIALPIWRERGLVREVCGVLGVGKNEPYEFSADEVSALIQEGKSLAESLQK